MSPSPNGPTPSAPSSKGLTNGSAASRADPGSASSGPNGSSNGASVPPGRRERKKRRTHVDLMRHASRLFASNGFDETTTEDIAEAADVSQRTFFRHFASKEAVLYGDMEDLRRQVRDALDARPLDEPVLTAVRTEVLSLADGYEAERDQRLLQARLAATYPAVSAYSRAVVQAEWEHELIDAISTRLGVDPVLDPRPEIIAGAAMSALRASIRRWTVGGGVDDLPVLVADAFDALAEIGELAAAPGGTV
jgi:AcrR family transcriptional regulator